MTKVIEYWYVEFNERFENVCEWTRTAVCIARHPSDWIKCKREFDDGVCEMNGNIRTLWEIVNANPITKDDYDIFIGNGKAES